MPKISRQEVVDFIDSAEILIECADLCEHHKDRAQKHVLKLIAILLEEEVTLRNMGAKITEPIFDLETVNYIESVATRYI